MFKKINFTIAILFSFALNISKSQSITLSGDIYEYATYYVNSFDFATGATNVQIFRYEVTSDQYPVSIKVRFNASMISPALEIYNDQVIISLETDPFQLLAPIVLDNRDLSSEVSTIFDADSPPNPVDLNGNIIDIINPSQADAILQSVLTTGQIADGEYTFEVIILSENDQVLASESRTFLIQSPSSIILESPGGALADTADNVIYSTFPIFQWSSQGCNGCNTFIRVSQYLPGVHSSAEEAIEDQRVLPFDQSEEWYQIENLNSYQYPPSDAYPLEEGNIYCWQLMKEIPTTSGLESMVSSIFSFTINQTGGENSNTSSSMNALLLALEQAIGQDQFNALFGSNSDLQDFIPTGQIEINEVSVDESSVNYLLNQISNNIYQIQSVSIE